MICLKMIMAKISEIADQLLDKAVIAAAVFNQIDQKHTDKIVDSVCRAGFSHRVRLAKMAAEETGMGVWQHKALKNTVATMLLGDDIRNDKTAGVISEDKRAGITEIAQPLGPILAIIPATNPTSTVLFKVMICMKSRNPVIICPSRRSVRSSCETAHLCYEAALAANAPEDCIQWIDEPSRELTEACLTHPKLALILATGGQNLVRASYSSGTPALGVGPGNVPVFIDRSADIPFAVSNIIESKTFDNGCACSSEQAVVVTREIADTVIAEFKKQSCYFLSPEEMLAVQQIAVDPATGLMNPDIVSQSAATIARKAGITVPADVQVLIARLDGVGKEYPLSGEVLAPILAFYVCDDAESAEKTCIELNYYGGTGHTACFYANDDNRISEFSSLMNAGRVLVNTPSSQGAVGGFYNSLRISLMLGCGSGGKNSTTENVTAASLINIKRVCRRRADERWQRFNKSAFFGEDPDSDEIVREYNRNY